MNHAQHELEREPRVAARVGRHSLELRARLVQRVEARLALLVDQLDSFVHGKLLKQAVFGQRIHAATVHDNKPDHVKRSGQKTGARRTNAARKSTTTKNRRIFVRTRACNDDDDDDDDDTHRHRHSALHSQNDILVRFTAADDKRQRRQQNQHHSMTRLNLVGVQQREPGDLSIFRTIFHRDFV